MNLALIGFGNVGRAFINLINDRKNALAQQNVRLNVTYVLDSKGGCYHSQGLETILYQEESLKNNSAYQQGLSIDSVLEDKEIDLVIELTPTNKITGEPAAGTIRKALSAGKHVVTGNKGPIMLYYKELKKLADKHSVCLGIDCTTGGALPPTADDIKYIASQGVIGIEGIFNGTTNYILSQMANDKITYDAALKSAQNLGIAETDPSYDVNGIDTAMKILILSNFFMNSDKTLPDIQVTGITGITLDKLETAMQSGEKIKLVGRSAFKYGDIDIRVVPISLPQEHPLYQLDYQNKGVVYKTESGEDIFLPGGMSSPTSAGEAILRDVTNICLGRRY